MRGQLTLLERHGSGSVSAMRLVAIGFVVLGCVACGDAGDGQDGAPTDAHGGADAAAGCSAAGPVEITLRTDDGVSLIADLYTTGQVGGPGAILLHMIPPGNSKDNYPAEFIAPLVARGVHVLNVNRRGAPGSGGEAEDAYLGPNGKLDAKAAYDYLTSHACAVPPAQIALVGASNGTTTALDFAVFAAGDASVEQPAAMVFLSGGSYTENQNLIANELDVLEGHPVYFAYPPGEAAWNDAIEASAPDTWTFVEYTPGGHGTQLFTSNPESIGDVVDFIDGIL